VTPTKKNCKREILEEISEKFMQKILDMANQNTQDASRQLSIQKIKNMKRHRNK
jgi:hypothetical protein